MANTTYTGHENCQLEELADASGQRLTVVLHQDGDVSFPVGTDESGRPLVATVPGAIMDQLIKKRQALLARLYGGYGGTTLAA